jgi:hypothetical protein
VAAFKLWRWGAQPENDRKMKFFETFFEKD